MQTQAPCRDNGWGGEGALIGLNKQEKLALRQGMYSVKKKINTKKYKCQHACTQHLDNTSGTCLKAQIPRRENSDEMNKLIRFCFFLRNTTKTIKLKEILMT